MAPALTKQSPSPAWCRRHNVFAVKQSSQKFLILGHGDHMTETPDSTDARFEFHRVLRREAAPHTVSWLSKRLAGFPERTMRDVVLAQLCADAPLAPLVRLLACAQREALRGDAHAKGVMDCIGRVLADNRFLPELVAGLTATAAELGDHLVVTMLSPVAANDPPPGDAPRNKRVVSMAEDGETLGHRKMLARSATGDALSRLLQDPHPEVIQNALQNPHVTEDMTIRLAARRPVGGGVLDAIARSRFQTSAQVRRAVILNPDCPMKLAQRLVGQLAPVDLHDVVHAPGVAKEIKTAARRLLDSR
jgi:hypothetical protein